MMWLLFAVMLLSGCSSSAPVYRTTIIRDTNITITPPPVISRLPVTFYSDTLIRGVAMRNGKTAIDIKYYPQTKMFELFAQPDNVEFRSRDTVVLYDKAADGMTTGTQGWVAASAALAVLAVYIWFTRK